jgi:TIR domain-containing protein
MTSLFISYSHRDEELRQQLETHLAMLKRAGVIDVWHDRRIVAGEHLDNTIDENLENADVVLLLVSPDFLASDYCYEREMKRAMERHVAGEVRVIAVILRHCDWSSAPFGRLTALPKNARPITKWPDRDEAFLDVVTGIKAALRGKPVNATARTAAVQGSHPAPDQTKSPRSSNLRARRHFTEADEDRFLEESFGYIANFFENTLKEFEARNPGVTTAFKRVSSEQFTAVAYRDGKEEARCRIQLGGRNSAMGGITFADGDASPSSNSYNESLSVEAGTQELHLKALGLPMHGERQQLSQEGAAEYFWELFVEPLQR